MSRERCAFLDIGTNTILCLIAELSGTGTFTVLDDLAEITRLGEGVDRTAEINPQGEKRSRDVLERYLKRCDELRVDKITAVGTSALRDAANSSEVRARFKQELSLEIRVISGSEEASYSFLAAQKGLSLAGRELLVIDIGGGSTEFIRGNDRGVSEALSLDLGSVRLTERFLHSDPVDAAEVAELVAVMDEAILPLADKWLQEKSRVTIVGIAGTFTTLAAVEKQLTRYSHSEVHGSVLTLEEIRRQVRLFQEKTLAERKMIAGLEPKRADVIFAGALLIERIMTSLGARQVLVSDQGVRYGLLYEQLNRQNFC